MGPTQISDVSEELNVRGLRRVCNVGSSVGSRELVGEAMTAVLSVKVKTIALNPFQRNNHSIQHRRYKLETPNCLKYQRRGIRRGICLYDQNGRYFRL